LPPPRAQRSTFIGKEDDTMQELGEEFGEDLENAKFHLEKMAG
jgi:hypothetical protein